MSKEFVNSCQRLFGRGHKGYGWQAEMHRQTGAPLTTIQKWASGVNPVPDIVMSLLHMVEEDRVTINLLKGQLHA
jgi:hypothetical protein